MNGRLLTSWWRDSRMALAAGGLLALIVVVAVGLLAWYAHGEALDSESDRGELLARVVEDQATRTFETAAIALSALAEVVSAPGQLDDASHLEAALAHASLGLPALRALALVTPGGTVLASSVAGEIGISINLAPLGALPPAGQTALGVPVRGRSLRALDRMAAVKAAPTGVGFIPLVSCFQAQGEQLLLVGMLNPDVFGNYAQGTLDGEPAGATALLLSFEGHLLAGAGDPLPDLGSLLSDHPVMQGWLARSEHDAQLVGDSQASRRFVAFRASRRFPLVAVIERPYEAAMARWRAGMRWLALGTAVGLCFIGAMSALAWRGLRAREASRQQLDEAQGQVARSERELSVLVKSVQELIFRTDADGFITFVNTRWLAVSGQDGGQAIGQRLEHFVQPADLPLVRALFALDREEGVRTAQVGVPGAEGLLRTFDVAVVPLRAGGEIIGFAGSAMDVSQRLQAEQQLMEQLSFTGLLLEISPLPMALCDTHGRLTSVNQAWESFTGCLRAEVLGQHGRRFFPTERAGRMRQDRCRYEARLRHSDGSLRDMVITQVQVHNRNPHLAGTLSVFMDVSEYREAERATREARDAAEDASRAKSEFIANISHELRTPLQAIIGFSELGMVRGRDQPRLAGMFGDVHAAGQRMLAVVNDLLDVAKIDGTAGSFRLQRTDLCAEVRAVVHELDPLLAKREQVVQLQWNDEPLLAQVDPMRFQQVVRNVLANAIKFSPAGSVIEVTGQPERGQVHLAFKDQGPGIPAAELEKVFEAFVQSSLTKDGAGGTGLGLAISRKIVEAHGGRIHAESGPAGGATFHVWLPATTPQAEAVQAEA